MMPAHTLPTRPVHRQLLAVFPALVLCLVLGAWQAQPASAASAIFNASCLPSHVANDDPIVYPGLPNAAHTHEFSGAWTTNAYSTGDSLRRSSTSCDPLEDTGAYWMPSLYMKGTRMDIDHTTAYYAAGRQSSDSQRAKIKAFPPDFRMIADLSNSSYAKTGYEHAGWMCGSEQVKWGYLASLTTIQYHCPYGLQLRIIFPDCWDGKNLDTVNPDGTPAVNPVTKKAYPNDHRSHVTYSLSNGNCPTEYPVGVPRMDLKVNYKTKGLVDSKAHRPKFTSASKIKDSTPLDPRKSNEGDNPSDFTIAGGNGSLGNPIDKIHPLSTMHADFFNGWKQEKLESLIDFCIRQKRAENDKLPCMHPDLSSEEQAKLDKLRTNPYWPNACPITPDGGGGTTDTTAPSKPANVKATAVNGTTVDVSWSPATDNVGVARYEIRRALGSGSSSVIATSVTTTYRDATAAPGTTYNYSVRAIDAAGNASATSSNAAVTTPQAQTPPPPTGDTTAPTAPSNLRGTAVSATQVDLAWNASSDAGGSGLRGYNVYRNGGSSPLNASPLSAPTYGDTGRAASTTYTYQVEAVDGSGNKSAKTSVSVTTPAPTQGGDTTAPAAPTNLKVTAVGPTTVALSWTAPIGELGVLRYEVRRAPKGGSSTAIATISGLTSYTDTTATANKAWDYKAKAIDAAGNMSPPSTTVSVITPAG